MKIAKSTGVIPKKYENRPDLFFKYLKAEEYIRKIRSPKFGQLDAKATAKKAGIHLQYDLTELSGELSVVDGLIEGIGNDKDKQKLAIRIKPTAKDPLFTFAHEMGHYFIEAEKEYLTNAPDQAVEDFCDYFANKLLGG